MCTAHVLMRLYHLINRSFVCKAKEGLYVRIIFNLKLCVTGEDLKFICFSDIFTLSLPDEGYCREIRYLRFHYYHCVDTSADGLLFPGSIIPLCVIRYTTNCKPVLIEHDFIDR